MYKVCLHDLQPIGIGARHDTGKFRGKNRRANQPDLSEYSESSCIRVRVGWRGKALRSIVNLYWKLEEVWMAEAITVAQLDQFLDRIVVQCFSTRQRDLKVNNIAFHMAAGGPANPHSQHLLASC
eukprot:SAG31_NODE_10391_length_1144_cov_0.780861_2_plen_125_part_00